MFENGIILLDKNIQYLLYINGYQLTMNSNNNKIMNINEIFSLEYLGRMFHIREKLPPKMKNKFKQQDEQINLNNKNFGRKKHDNDNCEMEFDHTNNDYLSNRSDSNMEYDIDKFEILKLQNR